MKTIAQQLNVKEYPFKIKDNNGNIIYNEYSGSHWFKREYNKKGNVIYYETNYGYIMDNRPKPLIELTMNEIADKFGIDVKLLKIKK